MAQNAPEKDCPIHESESLLQRFIGRIKDLFSDLDSYGYSFWVGLCFAVSGCAKRVVAPPSTLKDRSIETGVPGKHLEDLSPRSQASLRLTEQGRSLLEDGKASDAISTLERAINLDPTNGLNYYYLSEAWLFKGKFEQAVEFNGLARIYLKASPEWSVEVREQEERIREFSR